MNQAAKEANAEKLVRDQIRLLESIESLLVKVVNNTSRGGGAGSYTAGAGAPSNFGGNG